MAEKYAKKLFGEKEIESVLDRLDRLTDMESKMTVAQTYDVVCRLINEMQVVMEGARILSTYEYIHGTNDQSGRWQGVGRRYATEPRYVYLTGVIKYHSITWSSSPHAGDSN